MDADTNAFTFSQFFKSFYSAITKKKEEEENNIRIARKKSVYFRQISAILIAGLISLKVSPRLFIIDQQSFKSLFYPLRSNLSARYINDILNEFNERVSPLRLKSFVEIIVEQFQLREISNVTIL